MSEPIKVISLWQPWASLVAWGDKQIETRSWGTNYRGLIAIHAAKRWTREEKAQCREPFFREAMERKFEHICHADVMLPLGKIVAVARLANCLPMRSVAYIPPISDEDLIDPFRTPKEGRCITYDLGKELEISVKEAAFGNYANGRFAWMLSDVRALPEPIPFRGMQGLFDAPADLWESLQPILRTTAQTL
jgi:hypothetical protein